MEESRKRNEPNSSTNNSKIHEKKIKLSRKSISQNELSASATMPESVIPSRKSISQNELGASMPESAMPQSVIPKIVSKSHKTTKKPNNSNEWSNTNNEKLGTISSKILPDKETIIIGIYTHGKILGSSPCINLNDYPELKYFQKVSMGPYECINFISQAQILYIFDNLKRLVISKLKSGFSLLRNSRKMYKETRHPTKSEKRKGILEKNKNKYNTYMSDYHHRSYIFNKTNHQHEQNDGLILNKRFDFDYSLKHHFGIFSIYDGKTDKPVVNLSEYPKLNSHIIEDFPYEIFTTKKNIKKIRTTTADIISFFLSKGYTKILIHDISCNYHEFQKNNIPCSKYY
jgi:hypothetical protein